MILHDGNCAEFNINHVPPHVNPRVWTIPRNVRWEVSPAAPVSGWRYMIVRHIGGRVVEVDGFGDEPNNIWDGTLTAPRAGCDSDQHMLSRVTDLTHRALFHGPSPDPRCECGYRIVRNITELGRFFRSDYGWFADYPVDWLPVDQQEMVKGWGDTVHQSMVAVSVLGCGGVASAESEFWRDPDGTVRVEWLATDGWVIANEGDPVVDALVDWGATVCVVPEVNHVHEPGDCERFKSDYGVWRLSDPVPVDVVLEHGGFPDSSDRHNPVTRRFGSYGAAGVAVRRNRCVLLVLMGSRWQLPGGARVEGETAGECVVREMLEETGVNLAGVPVRSAFLRSDGAGWSYTTVIVDDPGITPVSAAEIDHVGWFAEPPVGAHPDLIETWGLL